MGLARKLGCDLACRLLMEGKIASEVLCNSDADARLPADYSSQVASACGERTVALSMPYRHYATDPALSRAADTYELYLRHQQSATEQAGSPYAYPALGSTLAVTAPAYCQVRGFPQRNAAEDFYLLNKLAKIGEVRYPTGTAVNLRARLSHRVP